MFSFSCFKPPYLNTLITDSILLFASQNWLKLWESLRTKVPGINRNIIHRTVNIRIRNMASTVSTVSMVNMVKTVSTVSTVRTVNTVSTVKTVNMVRTVSMVSTTRRTRRLTVNNIRVRIFREVPEITTTITRIRGTVVAITKIRTTAPVNTSNRKEIGIIQDHRDLVNTTRSAAVTDLATDTLVVVSQVFTKADTPAIRIQPRTKVIRIMPATIMVFLAQAFTILAITRTILKVRITTPTVTT